MEAFFTFLIITLFVLWLVQRNAIDRNVRECRELEAKLSAWSAWGYNAQRQSDALRNELTSVTQRLIAVEARLAQSPVVAPAASVIPPAHTESKEPPGVVAPSFEIAATPAPDVIASAPDVIASAPDVIASAPDVIVSAPAALNPDVVAPTQTTIDSQEIEIGPNDSAEPIAPSERAPDVAPHQDVAAYQGLTPQQDTASQQDEAPRYDATPPPSTERQDSKGFRPPKVNWESLIGVRLFSWIAGISLLLGAVFFLRYSAESGWLNPPVRMAMGLLTGILLLVACEWKGQHYRVTANAMDAAGIGTLFATSFAAYAVWHLVPAAVAMGLLVLVTCVAVLLSLRRDSLFIALLGLVGGFSTPVLLSTGENHPFGLFGYLLLLNVGLAVVGYRKGWAILTGLSLALTTLYQWGWFAKFVFDDAQELPIAVGVFLLFPIVWFVFARYFGKKCPTVVPSWLSQVLTYTNAFPLLLALVMAWVPAFSERYLLLFSYLFALNAALLCLDYFRPKDQLGLIASLSTGLVWLTWTSLHYTSDCWPHINAILGGFVVLFLARVWVGTRLKGFASSARFTAPVLLGVVTLFLLEEPLNANPLIAFGTLLTLFAGVAATAIYSNEGRLYYVAAPFVILAEGVWSSKYLDESRLNAGLLVYLLSALLCIGIPVLSRRLARPLEPNTLSIFVPVLSLLVLVFLAIGNVAAHSLWVLGVLLLVLNVGCFIEAKASRRHPFAFFGIALSWLVVVLWWQNALQQKDLVLALVVVLTLLLLEVSGLIWLLRSKNEESSGSPFEQSPLLGLVGHLFLLFVASQPNLGSPPWPLFAIAFLLDLGLIAATLYLRRALFAMASFAVTLLVFGVWAIVQTIHLSPLFASEVALIAAALVIALSEVLPLISSRRKLAPNSIRLGANINLLLGFGLLVTLALLEDSPRMVGLTLAQVILLGLLMRSARTSGRHGWVLGGWLGTVIFASAWATTHHHASVYEQLLTLVAVPYVLFNLYPFYCTFRAKLQRLPFVAAVAGSISFFALGYLALRESPLQGYLGALPLLESFVAAGLLVYVLRVTQASPPGDVGLVALIAAVALGFATTAIPLQLKNEWLTVAWALETTALAWLYRRLRHPGLLGASLALAVAVTLRLSVNPEVFIYHTRSQTPLLNFYLYAYGVSAIALFGASKFLGAPSVTQFPWLRKSGVVQSGFATLLLFILLNIEIADYYSVGEKIVFRFSSTLAQDLTYTLGWALFAIGMLIAGIVSKGSGVRIASLVLLTLTIAKCFLHDLWRLGGLYRVGSFVGLALCLSLVAIILQRFVLRPQNDRANP
jgi:hypothetical protein